MKYGLGRVPSEPDDRDYDMGLLLAAEPLRSYQLWHSDRVLNQGKTPHCVGFGWAGWGICTPVESQYDNTTAHKVYRAAKVVDGDPAGENGSSVKSGAKAMKGYGRIKSYYFGTFSQAKEFVSNHGSVVIGIPWTEGMFQPDSYFVIHPTGGVSGGHCLLWVGLDGDCAILLNSWGTGWGDGGYCKILLSDLEALIRNNGEACAAVENPILSSPNIISSLFSSLFSSITKIFGR
jgi:hypothetical protein